MAGPNELELLLVSIRNANNKVYIGLWYRPPANFESLNVLYSILESLDVRFLSSFILLGGFNVDFYNHQHPLFHKLSRIVHRFVLTQVVPEQTHTNPSGSSTLIDLALLSAPSQVLNCNVIPPLSNSYHNGFTLTLKWSWHPPLRRLKNAVLGNMPRLILRKLTD